MKNKIYVKIKKILSITLALCIVTLLMPIQGHAEQINSLGRVYTNFPNAASTISGEYKESAIKINEVNISNSNSIMLDGNLLYDNNNLNIRVEGSLYKGLLDNSLYGKVVDTSNNFDILFLAIKDKPNESDLLVDKSLKDKSVLYLYTMNKKTRDLILFEINLNTIYDGNIIYTTADKADDPLIEQWWVKILTPVVGDGDSEISSKSDSASNISEASTTIVSQPKTFTYVLDTDNTYTYYIKLTARAATKIAKGHQTKLELLIISGHLI